MVNQILLGETAIIQEETERWYKIISDYDGYEGWVNKSQMSYLSENDYKEWTNHPERKHSIYFSFFAHNQNRSYLVPVGSNVIIGDNFIELPDGKYKIDEKLKPFKKSNLLETAMQFLGTPYLWGGRTENGIDCSGFIQTVYALHDMRLPRDSGKQAGFIKENFHKIEDAEAGDIIYFSTKPDTITHVGFYLGDGILLHASGNVKQNIITPWKHNNVPFAFNQRLYENIALIQSAKEIEKYFNIEKNN